VRRFFSTENLLTLLCVFTLLGVQIFGGIGGYLCRCGGQEALTAVDHCHGPHSEACHDESDHDVARESHKHDESSDASREEHQPVRANIQLVQTAGVSAPEFQMVVAEILSAQRFVTLLEKTAHVRTHLRSVYFAPPPGILLRQTVALLV
jgi:hypothetical protein